MEPKLQIFVCRHGETEWTISGQHTSTSNIPLTEQGKLESLLMGEKLHSIHLLKVFTSPLLRAKETCALAGFKKAVEDPDLIEWDYGKYEGLKHSEIIERNPSWDLFSDGAPDGESPQEIADRADRFLKKARTFDGPIALFSHGHFCRVLAARWLDLPPSAARFFTLSTASISVLSYERTQPVIQLWNEHPIFFAPLLS